MLDFYHVVFLSSPQNGSRPSLGSVLYVYRSLYGSDFWYPIHRLIPWASLQIPVQTLYLYLENALNASLIGHPFPNAQTPRYTLPSRWTNSSTPLLRQTNRNWLKLLHCFTSIPLRLCHHFTKISFFLDILHPATLRSVLASPAEILAKRPRRCSVKTSSPAPIFRLSLQERTNRT